jgi:hypothetical protein
MGLESETREVWQCRGSEQNLFRELNRNTRFIFRDTGLTLRFDVRRIVSKQAQFGPSLRSVPSERRF